MNQTHFIDLIQNTANEFVKKKVDVPEGGLFIDGILVNLQVEPPTGAVTKIYYVSLTQTEAPSILASPNTFFLAGFYSYHGTSGLVATMGWMSDMYMLPHVRIPGSQYYANFFTANNGVADQAYLIIYTSDAHDQTMFRGQGRIGQGA